MGEKFNYLGVEMIVTNHSRMVSGYDYIGLIPSLQADYVDNNGILHNVSFGYHELVGLKNENPQSGNED